jgi:hypothetical protein
MDWQPEGEYRLPVRRAFVVQFGVETEVEQERFVGCVEHIVSGQAAQFQTLEALLTFMRRVLSTPATTPEASPERLRRNDP